MLPNLLTESSKIIRALHVEGVIPVFFHADVTVSQQVFRLIARSGMRFFEWSHHRDSRSLRIFSSLMEEELQHPLIAGAGNVLDVATTQEYIKAGAQFITSPFLRPQMAEVCHQHNVLWIPGCSSLEDIRTAKDCGAIMVNILVGNILGTTFMQQARSTFPDMYMAPSGGVTLQENNLKGWFDAGALCVRLGEPLFTREAVAGRDWIRVERSLHSTAQCVRKIQVTSKKSDQLYTLQE